MKSLSEIETISKRSTKAAGFPWGVAEEVGKNIRMFDYQYHLPDLNNDSQQRKDIERFRWFSQDYLGYDNEKNLVTDIRYSMIPNQIAPMWGLVIDNQRGINEHAIWWTSRSLDQSQIDLFKEMLSGKKCRNLK